MPAVTHRNGTAKFWGKSLLGLAELVFQEQLSDDLVPGTVEADSMYHVQLIIKNFF